MSDRELSRAESMKVLAQDAELIVDGEATCLSHVSESACAEHKGAFIEEILEQRKTTADLRAALAKEKERAKKWKAQASEHWNDLVSAATERDTLRATLAEREADIQRLRDEREDLVARLNDLEAVLAGDAKTAAARQVAFAIYERNEARAVIYQTREALLPSVKGLATRDDGLDKIVASAVAALATARKEALEEAAKLVEDDDMWDGDHYLDGSVDRHGTAKRIRALASDAGLR